MKTSPLIGLTVASPCSEKWSDMTGDERVRACAKCRLNVYNLSDMTEREAEKLLLDNEGGRVCVRFYQRADGTVITKDCPVGLRALRVKLATGYLAALTVAAALIAALLPKRYEQQVREAVFPATAVTRDDKTPRPHNPHLINEVAGGIGAEMLMGKPASRPKDQ